MISPFKENAISSQFLKDGYCTLDLFTESEVEKVVAIYNELNSGDIFEKSQFFGVNYSVASLEQQKSALLVDRILLLIKDRLNDFFYDYEIFGTLFINKPAETHYGFDYHQDWSYTDESRFAFVTCWLPLIDVNEKNGAMTFINGSHKFFKNYRSENFDSARFPIEQVPLQMRSDVSMKKGECLCFNPATFHGSYPNSTDTSRPVLGFGIKPRLSPLYHYLKKGDKIDVLEIPVAQFNDFIVSIPKGVFPEGVIIKESIPNDNYMPDLHDILKSSNNINSTHLIFKDPVSQDKYQKHGFVHLENVFPESIIDDLARVYESNFKTQPGMYVTHHNCTTVDQNKKISDKLFDIISPFVQKYFKDYKTVIAHFAAKSSQGKDSFNMHQDWSIVDEAKFDIAHLWIPLHDTNSENGTLCVIPGSHLLFHNYRSGSCGIRFSDIDRYNNVLVKCDAKKGDIIVYHPSLFHGSGPNRTDKDRIAVIASLCDKDAQLTYYHKEEDDVYAYQLSEVDLFSRLADLAEGKSPTGEKLGLVSYNVLSISDDDLEKELNKKAVAQ